MSADARTPVVAMTASVTAEEREHCRLVGINDFAPKPVSLATLSATPDRWVRAPGRHCGRVSVRRAAAMVAEHALLPVRPRQEEVFGAALVEALPSISAAPGFRGITVSRGVEGPFYDAFPVVERFTPVLP